MGNISIIHSFIYLKIMKKYRIFISLDNLKEEIGRSLIRSHGGLPRSVIPYVIRELGEIKLIKRVNKNTFEILKNDCYKNAESLEIVR